VTNSFPHTFRIHPGLQRRSSPLPSRPSALTADVLQFHEVWLPSIDLRHESASGLAVDARFVLSIYTPREQAY